MLPLKLFRRREALLLLCVLGLTLLALACSGGTSPPNAGLKGIISIDGSSSVYPITEAVAEEFGKLHRDVKVTVGISGTGGGFKKFGSGETDITDASRPISASEVALADKNGIQFIELPVAYDGLSVMVNPQNNWVTSLTTAELKEIWKPESKIARWSDIRPGWPDKKLVLVGPDTDSGTFDYFTAAIVGKEKSSRADYTWSSDDNVLVEAIAGERYALGYFGYAFYAENARRLKLVAIDAGKGPILPSPETVRDGIYQPLSRPLFIYVKTASAGRPEVQEFIKFYLTAGASLVSQVGYIALPQRAYDLALGRFEKRIPGSLFGGHGSQVGVP